MKTRNVVLIGMRNSGKTTIAKLLAQKLNREYIDLDEMIAKKMNMSISQIVEKYGWDFFRDKESEVAGEASSLVNKIISTGGGIVTRSINIKALKRKGVIIFLRATVKTLLDRDVGYSDRPPLTNNRTQKEEVRELFKRRDKLYKKSADAILDVDNLNTEQAVNKILSDFESYKKS